MQNTLKTLVKGQNIPLILTFGILLLITLIGLCFYLSALSKRAKYIKTSDMNIGIKSGARFSISKIIATFDLIVLIIIPSLLYLTNFLFAKFDLYKKVPDLMMFNKTVVYVSFHIIEKSNYFIIVLLIIKVIFDLLILLTAKKFKINVETKVKDQDEDEFLLLKEKVLANTVKEDKETRLFIIIPPKTRADSNNLLGLNSELTNEGKEEAKLLIDKIGLAPDIIFTSCMLSAKQTALFMSEIIGKKSLSVFDECNLGDFEGLDKNKYKFFEENDYPQNMPQKYHADNFTKRAQEAIEEIKNILYKHKEKKIVIISHPFLINSINALINEKIITKNASEKIGFLNNGSFIEVDVNCFDKNDARFIKSQEGEDE